MFTVVSFSLGIDFKAMASTSAVNGGQGSNKDESRQSSSAATGNGGKRGHHVMAHHHHGNGNKDPIRLEPIPKVNPALAAAINPLKDDPDVDLSLW